MNGLNQQKKRTNYYGEIYYTGGEKYTLPFWINMFAFATSLINIKELKINNLTIEKLNHVKQIRRNVWETVRKNTSEIEAIMKDDIFCKDPTPPMAKPGEKLFYVPRNPMSLTEEKRRSLLDFENLEAPAPPPPAAPSAAAVNQEASKKLAKDLQEIEIGEIPGEEELDVMGEIDLNGGKTTRKKHKKRKSRKKLKRKRKKKKYTKIKNKK